MMDGGADFRPLLSGPGGRRCGAWRVLIIVGLTVTLGAAGCALHRAAHWQAPPVAPRPTHGPLTRLPQTTAAGRPLHEVSSTSGASTDPTENDPNALVDLTPEPPVTQGAHIALEPATGSDQQLLEVAAVIYAVSTLLKIAALSQLLEFGLTPFNRDMLAGAGGALATALLLYPLDTLKTRAQLRRPSDPRGLYRGVFLGLLRDVPAGALYVAVFYAVRDALFVLINSLIGSLVIPVLSIAVATLVASVLRAPFEAVTRRVQSGVPPRTALAVTLTHAAGPRAPLLVALWFTLWGRDFVYYSLQWLCFWILERAAFWQTFGEALPSPTLRLILTAVVVGSAAATVSAPLDAFATHLAVTDPSVPPKGPLQRMMDAAQQMGGFKGYFRGNGFRCVYSVLHTAFFYSVVDAIRRALW